MAWGLPPTHTPELSFQPAWRWAPHLCHYRPSGQVIHPPCVPFLTGSSWHISTACHVTVPWRHL